MEEGVKKKGNKKGNGNKKGSTGEIYKRKKKEMKKGKNEEKIEGKQY